MSTPVYWHRGITAGGKFTPANPRAFRGAFEAVSGDTEVAVRKYYENRSIQQNRYLFGVVYKTISDYTGYTVEEVHERMAALFLSRLVRLKTTKRKGAKGKLGKKKKPKWIRIVKSTADLSTVKFNWYVEKIKRFAAVNLDGLYIEDPDVTKRRI